MTVVNYLAVIPARGGSKRVSRKNIRPLGGMPLIYHSINAAVKASKVDDFVLSTEDEEIHKCAENLVGQEISYKRPVHLAGDEVRNSATMLDAVQWYETHHDTTVKNIVLLQPTSPFRTAEDIDEAIASFALSDHDVLASVTGPYSKRHLDIKKVDQGSLVDFCKDYKDVNYFKLNASIYIVTKSFLEQRKAFTAEAMAYYVMPEERSVDIDTEFDFKLAEALWHASS